MDKGEKGKYAREIDEATNQSVVRLAGDHPAWIPVLKAAESLARSTEPISGQFAGRWVLEELERQTGVRKTTGLRRLVAYGLLENAGPSTRGGRRAYYRMPERETVERALARLPEGYGLAELQAEAAAGQSR